MAYLIERDYKEFYTKAAEKAEDENIKKNSLNNWLNGKQAMKRYLKKRIR